MQIGDAAQDLRPVATNLVATAEVARRVDGELAQLVVGEARHESVKIVAIRRVAQPVQNGDRIDSGPRLGDHRSLLEFGKTHHQLIRSRV